MEKSLFGLIHWVNHNIDNIVGSIGDCPLVMGRWVQELTLLGQQINSESEQGLVERDACIMWQDLKQCIKPEFPSPVRASNRDLQLERDVKSGSESA